LQVDRNLDVTQTSALPTDISDAQSRRAKVSSQARPQIVSALERLDAWIEKHQFTGYEPFDGLSSFLRPLTFGTKFGRQALVQAVKRAPFNVRPWIGIHPATSTKGMGFLARGYLRWNQLQPGKGLNEKADNCLNWLRLNRSPGFSGPCWGNHFDYQTRTYYLPANFPTIVWSSLIGHAFVDCFELTGCEADLQEARGTCEFILRDLPRYPDEKGTCISYVSHADVRVHNANALGAALLSRVYKHTHEQELYETATAALAYTAGHQNPDGSWFYGEPSNLRWIDNWHTAYVLDSFLDYEEGTGDKRFRATSMRGWEFYFGHFFRPDGCPAYYHDRVYPIDIQCASQSIETLCRFGEWNPEAVSTAVRVAEWTIANMQDSSGYFYFQRHPHYVNRTACFHWGQATMLSALSLLLLQLQK
jgi:polysaccharide biosynthesis protein VpsJ